MTTTESEHPIQSPPTPTSPEKEQIPPTGYFSPNIFLKTTTKTLERNKKKVSWADIADEEAQKERHEDEEASASPVIDERTNPGII